MYLYTSELNSHLMLSMYICDHRDILRCGWVVVVVVVWCCLLFVVLAGKAGLLGLSEL